MKRLIVNADDFGITRGVNRGIVDCHRRGIVTSTTLMVNGEAAAAAARLAAENPSLGVGLHLNLSSGRPVLPPERVPTLVRRDGGFPGAATMLARLSAGVVERRELEGEIAAQLQACRSLGIEPTHVDSHHHLHAHPVLATALVRVCRREGIDRARGFKFRPGSVKAAAIRLAAFLPRRLKTPDRLAGIEVMGERDVAAYLEEKLALPGDVLEYMCHPGYVDERLMAVTSYNRLRLVELEALLSPEVRQVIAAAGVELVSFREL